MKFIALTEYALNHLSPDVIDELNEMIGCDVFLMEDENFYSMPDGYPCHKDFLIIE